MKALIPEIEAAWKAYVDVYVKFENKRRIVASYVHRGIIKSEMIPAVEKKKLIDELKEYRKRRKTDG